MKIHSEDLAIGVIVTTVISLSMLLGYSWRNHYCMTDAKIAEVLRGE